MKKEVKGIFWKGALWYFDKTEDFMAAFPGFKLWIGVENGEKIPPEAF